MTDVVGKFTEKNAETAHKGLTSDLVGKPKSSRFSGSPKADKRQAAADAKVMTAQPKPAARKHRWT